MEQVVKEMSHLFQFFPKEIPPLEYPDQTDMAVDEDPDDLESPSSEPSGTNSSTSSALTRTSFQIPRKDEAVENLLPVFNHTMDLSKTTQEPLHLIIGEVENEDSAEGYAIRPLDNDFLTGNQSTPVNPAVIPRRPQQFHPPIKRRSVELPAAFTPPPPVHPSLPGASAMWSHPSSGHRRSASHGNPTELWGFIGGVVQHQQSMPCISNLEPIRTSGESSFWLTQKNSQVGQLLNSTTHFVISSLAPAMPFTSIYQQLRIVFFCDAFISLCVCGIFIYW